MVKKSTVTNVQSTGTWQNKEGKEFYKYEVEMENGDAGEYSSISDSQDKFVKGQEVEYNYTDGKFPKIKPHYTNPTSSSYSYTPTPSTNDEQIARSVGLKAAVELGVAQGLELSEILETAKIMADFITTEKTIEVSNNSDSVPF